MFRLLLVLAPCLTLASLPDADPRTDALGDPLPPGALVRLGSVRMRLPESINCLAMSPDGKTVLAGAYNSKIFVFDVATGKLRAEWQSASYVTYGLHYSKDGKVVVAGSGDSTVRIFDARTGDLKRVLADPKRRHSDTFPTISPNKQTLLMFDRDERELIVWDLVTGGILHRHGGLRSYDAPPPSYTPDGKRFVCLWSDGRLHLVDVFSGKSVRCLEPDVADSKNSNRDGSSRVGGLAVTEDGKSLVYRLVNDGGLRVVDLETAKSRTVSLRQNGGRSSYYNNAFMSGMALSPNGRFLYEASGEGAIRVWGLASGKALRELIPPSGQAYFLSVSADGSRVAGGYNNVIHVWDVNSGKELHDGPGHTSSVHKLLFSPDGRELFTIGGQTLRRWDVGGGAELGRARLMSGGYGMTHLEQTADGKAVEWLGYDRQRYRWNFLEGGEAERVGSAPREVSNYYNQYAISRDGRTMAGVHRQDRKLRLIDLTGAKPEREITTLSEPYSNTLVFSPDGRLLALGQRDRSVTLIDVATGTEARKIMPDPDPEQNYNASTVLFAEDSRSLLVYNGDLRLIETHTGVDRLRLPREASAYAFPSALALSEDGRVVARAHHDGLVIAYDAWTGREVLRAQTEQGAVNALAISRDNRKLATAGANTTALVYELPPLGGPPRVPHLSDDAAWRELAEPSGERAFRAMVHLLATPETLPRLVRERIKPPPPVDPARITRLIAELDSEIYAVREKAWAELERAGAGAREPLRKATRSLVLEVKRKAEDLLGKLDDDGAIGGERQRALRAAEVLGRIGTPAAREALREMLKSGLGPVVDEAVKAALGRDGESRPKSN